MTSHFSLNVFILKICQILLIIMSQILFHIPPKLTISTSNFQNFLSIGEGSPLPKPHPRHKPFHFLILTFLSLLPKPEKAFMFTKPLCPAPELCLPFLLIFHNFSILQSPLSCVRNLIIFFAYFHIFLVFVQIFTFFAALFVFCHCTKLFHHCTRWDSLHVKTSPENRHHFISVTIFSKRKILFGGEGRQNKAW